MASSRGPDAASQSSVASASALSVASKTTASRRNMIEATHRVTRGPNGTVEGPKEFLNSNDPRIRRWESASIEEAIAFVRMPHTSWKSVLTLSLLPFAPRNAGDASSSVASVRTAPNLRRITSSASTSSSVVSGATCATQRTALVKGKIIRGPSLVQGLRDAERQAAHASLDGAANAARKLMRADEKIRQWTDGQVMVHGSKSGLGGTGLCEPSSDDAIPIKPKRRHIANEAHQGLMRGLRRNSSSEQGIKPVPRKGANMMPSEAPLLELSAQQIRRVLQ